MALVSFLPPVRREIPHEPDQWMDFRKPASKDVRAARKLAEAEGRQGLRDFGAEIVTALQSKTDSNDDAVMRRIAKLAAEQEYHADQFDRGALLAASIRGWSYMVPDETAVPVNPENIGLLDEQTARWAVQQVIDLMQPPSLEADKSDAPAAAPSA